MARPKYVDPYLQELAGPDEQHGLGGDCMSPYCNYEFTPEDYQKAWGDKLTCPLCGYTNNLYEMEKPIGEPGGTTRAGLTLKEMGDIGENLIFRLGELPGVGTITPASDAYNWAIDAIVEAPQGKFGCEIKTNHAQPLDSLILTPAGWKTMGEMQIGDQVVNPEGGRATVIGLSERQDRETYQVTFSDKSSIECDIEHLWKVRGPHPDRGWKVVPLGEIASEIGNRAYIPLVSSVEFESSHLPIDPYLLGLLLGDGNFSQGQTYFCTSDQELVERIAELLPEGVEIRKCKRASSDYLYVLTTGKRGTRNLLRQQLRQLGLDRHRAWEKFIPLSYKFASPAERLALLRGLMDTDGSVEEKSPTQRSFRFYSTSSQLASDVQEMIWSLGGVSNISVINQHLKKANQTSFASKHPLYSQNVSMPINPFSLKRKAEKWQRTRGPSRRIISVEAIGVKTMQCLLLDSNNQLYVTDNFTVTHNSQAQERFKLGDRQERLKKLQYCYENGLKPAIIGVRLNFFTSLAYVFFREGLTDTWIGNSKMQHVGTFNFEDLNPFKSFDPQAQAIAIQNAHIPDQAEGDEFGGVFGNVVTHTPKALHSDGEKELTTTGRFVFNQDVEEMKVQDGKGKHTHNLRRCARCGHLNAVRVDHAGLGRLCSTCGEDPVRDPKHAKIVLATREADQVAQQLGFQFFGRTGQGYRKYSLMDKNGTDHTIVVGTGAHGKNAPQIDADRAKHRMTSCLNDECSHITTSLPAVVENDPFVARSGQVVLADHTSKFLEEPDGGLVLVYDAPTRPQEPLSRHAASEDDPSYLFVFYMGELRVEEYQHNRDVKDMFEDLLAEFNMDLQGSWNEIKQSDIDTGKIWENGRIEHENLTDPDVKEKAEDALKDWWQEEKDKDWKPKPEDDWETLNA